jgi:hypothetical protein
MIRNSRFAEPLANRGLEMETTKHEPKFSPYTHPAGGWGSVQSLGRSLAREHVPLSGPRILTRQNKPDGFACITFAWARPAKPHPFEFCEEGAKASTWEITVR